MSQIDNFESGKAAPARLNRNYNSVYIHQTPKGPVTYVQKKYPTGNNWQLDSESVVPIPVPTPVVPDSLFSYTVVLDKSTVNALNITPVNISNVDLGLASGEAVLVDIQKTIVDIITDGLPFAMGGFSGVSVNNDNNDSVALLSSSIISSASDSKYQMNASINQLAVADGGLTISAGDPITDGGANAELRITIFYTKAVAL